MELRIQKMSLVLAVLTLFLFSVAWAWPWSFSWEGTWKGQGKVTLCGKETDKTFDVNLNLNPSGEVIFTSDSIPYHSLGSVTITPTKEDGALVGLIGEKLFGYFYPWEEYGKLRKEANPYSPSPPSGYTLTVNLSKEGSWLKGYKLKGTMTGYSEDCPNSEGKINNEGRVISVELTRN